jgi:serine/threonine-protein kinase 11
LIDGQGAAKLADFGVGHSFASAAMVVGSPAYQAPEALDDSYGSDEEGDSLAEGAQKEDVWALGVTFFELLFLRLPFQGDDLFQIVRDIKENGIDIPNGTDREVKHVLKRMLEVDPSKRASIDELLQDPLFANATPFAEGLPEVPSPTFKAGKIVELEARVCSDGFSFANLTPSVPRRFSFPRFDHNGGGERRQRRISSHSDREDNDSYVIGSC